ncbi:MAG TPA: cytochrome c oxidase subunit II [Steroidobacteraceae bacterium]|jgi:cytochrome c oxidase subunit 2|nr:cytochrome c oxidase subunit II [Steroidobacteraceae bacterium]
MRVTRGSIDHSTSRPRQPFTAAALCLAASGLANRAGANTSNGYNLPTGVTDLARDMYGLHMEVFWICVGIAVVVFGAMIFTLVKFRRSQGAVADVTMLHSTKVEIIWTIIPVIILVVMAIPAAELILKQEDTRNSQLSIRVTGYQWKWEYNYMDAATGVDFFSTLARSSNFARQLRSGIDPNSVPNYLLDVDKPMVIPSGTKVRLLITSQDVIHAWWVPDFGAKRSAVPGFINELWFRVDPGKEGIYRGQCTSLCGRDHAFMPIVVDVRTPDEFKKWVDEQKAAAKQAALPAGAPGAAATPAPPPTAQALTK